MIHILRRWYQDEHSSSMSKTNKQINLFLFFNNNNLRIRFRSHWLFFMSRAQSPVLSESIWNLLITTCEREGGANYYSKTAAKTHLVTRGPKRRGDFANVHWEDEEVSRPPPHLIGSYSFLRQSVVKEPVVSWSSVVEGNPPHMNSPFGDKPPGAHGFPSLAALLATLYDALESLNPFKGR